MGKHVCPVCEDVYAVQASVDVRQRDRSEITQGWACPGCGYTFVAVQDVARLLQWAVEPYDAGPVSATGSIPEGSPVTRRFDALAASSSQ